MREQWAQAFAASAQKHWTAERTEDLVRGKKLLILPGEAPVLLRALGLLLRDATMPPYQTRKFFQINHMVTALAPAMAELRQRFPVVRMLDAGCGRSYLSMLLAWCFVHRWHHPVEILGIDRKPALIDECRRRIALVELDGVTRYGCGALDDLDLPTAWQGAFGAAPEGELVHAVLALHACDTATDDAIVLGVQHAAHLIAVAPCCHAELARGWAELAAAASEGALAPIWAAPHLRRSVAAHITDTMRMLLLRTAGYDTRAIEFVGSAHTAKNTLIRGVRREVAPEVPLAEYAALRAATGGVAIGLEDRLHDIVAKHREGVAKRPR